MKIAIVGGGASGLTAAICAARNGGRVVIFEKNDSLGRKILATGNGKCNLSNTEISEKFYNSSDINFVFNAFEKFGLNSTVNFFQGLGLLLTEKRGGLYPHSEQAVSVLDALRNETESLGVTEKLNCNVSKVIPFKDGFKVYYMSGDENRDEYFDRVIITSGGRAGALKESSGNSYELARQAGHKVSNLYPALTGLKCEGKFWKSLAGVRTTGRVSVLIDGKEAASDIGEIQLTDYGISGIPVFQVSRFATSALGSGKKVSAVIDFMPALSSEEFLTELKIRELVLMNRTCEQFLNGFFNKKITSFFLKQLQISPDLRAEELDLKRFTQVCKNFSVKVLGDTGFEHAQVTAGGVLLDEIDENFQSKLVKGLYFAGEILDVDGLCGGYNLQWAWTSGHIAGEAAARA